MNKESKQFYLVDFSILPSAIKKTIRAKELLKNGEAETINAAVQQTGISRSAYYKYKDHVAPAHADSMDGTFTLFVVMQNDSSVGNKILRRLGRENIEILTMNRGLPVRRLTTMSISIHMTDMQISLQDIIEDVQSVKGVKHVYVVGEE